MSVLDVRAPMSGWIQPLDEVPDAAFSSGAMGAGLSIEPLDDCVRAPFDGTILSIAKSRHAITIAHETGVELLIHFGIETVQLDGEGFDTLVEVGDQVSVGQPLLRIELASVMRGAKSLATPIIILGADRVQLSNVAGGKIAAIGDHLFSVSAGARVDTGAPDHKASGEIFTRKVRLPMQHGLHARPSARIVDVAKNHAAEIEVVLNGKSASANSISQLMLLGAQFGDEIELRAWGEGAELALSELSALIEGGAGDPVAPSAAHYPGRPSPEPEPEPGNAAGDAVMEGEALPGVGVTSAIATGQTMIWQPDDASWQDRVAQAPEIEEVRFDEAVAALDNDLTAQSATSDSVLARLMEAHRAVLADPGFRQPVTVNISAGMTAEGAVSHAIAAMAQQFEGLGDPRLAERAQDLRDVGQRLISHLQGEGDEQLPEMSGRILLADDMTPSRVVAAIEAGAAGICTSRGGATSHAAILAAAADLPMIVGAGPRLLTIQDGRSAAIDAALGQISLDPSEEDLAAIRNRIARRELLAAAAEAERHDPVISQSGDSLTVSANLGSLDDARRAVESGAQGCGLLRTEVLFQGLTAAPSVDEQAAVYQQIADTLGGHGLTIRTLDAGSDKPLPFIHLPQEDNPALGLRGIRTAKLYPEALAHQLRACARLRHKGPLRVMLPMVNDPADIVAARRILAEHTGAAEISFGIMIETPSAALVAEQIAPLVDFFSIGSNDLAQYTLAMDRLHPDLAREIDPLHPAILRLIHMAATAAAPHHNWTSICGGMAGDPLALPILYGLGITSFSVGSAAIGKVKAVLRLLDRSECQVLASKALGLSGPSQVRQTIVESCPEVEEWL